MNWAAIRSIFTLGMEAVRKIEVVDFPAIILVDDKGNDSFSDILRGA